jgi:hypothetical protein
MAKRHTSMATPFVDGQAFSWQRLCDLRRQQLEAWKKEQSATTPQSHAPSLGEVFRGQDHHGGE